MTWYYFDTDEMMIEQSQPGDIGIITPYEDQRSYVVSSMQTNGFAKAGGSEDISSKILIVGASFLIKRSMHVCTYAPKLAS